MRVKDMQSGGAYLINRRWAIRAGGPTPDADPELARRKGEGTSPLGVKVDLIAVGALVRYDLLGKIGTSYMVTMWLNECDEVLPIGEGTFSEIQKEVREHDVRMTQLRFRVIDTTVGAALLNETAQ